MVWVLHAYVCEQDESCHEWWTQRTSDRRWLNCTCTTFMYTGVFQNDLVQFVRGLFGKKLHFKTYCEPGKYSQNWSACRCVPKLGECFKSEMNLVFHLRKFYLTNYNWKQQRRQLEYKWTYTHVLLLFSFSCWIVTTFCSCWQQGEACLLQLPYNLSLVSTEICGAVLCHCARWRYRRALRPNGHHKCTFTRFDSCLWIVILGQLLGRKEKEALRETPKACRSGKMEVMHLLLSCRISSTYAIWNTSTYNGTAHDKNMHRVVHWTCLCETNEWMFSEFRWLNQGDEIRVERMCAIRLSYEVVCKRSWDRDVNGRNFKWTVE